MDGSTDTKQSVTKPVRLLNSTEVAKIMGVTPSALSNWKSRDKTGRLPMPDFVVGHSPLWYPETIKEFLGAQWAEVEAKLSDY
jgi:hypothetical protein